MILSSKIVVYHGCTVRILADFMKMGKGTIFNYLHEVSLTSISGRFFLVLISLLFAITIFPINAFAQSFSVIPSWFNFEQVFLVLRDILSLGLLISFLAFLWGIISFIIYKGDNDKRFSPYSSLLGGFIGIVVFLPILLLINYFLGDVTK